MTNRVSAIIGSGTLPYTQGILPVLQRGNEADGEGIRTGDQVMLGNPEDVIAVDAFVASGIIVSTTSIQITGPGINLLPRSRMIIMSNVTSPANTILISHKENFANEEGFELLAGAADRKIKLPLLHNVCIWARTASSIGTLKILVY